MLDPVLASSVRATGGVVLGVVAVGVLLGGLLLESGVLADGGVGLGVDTLQIVSRDTSSDVLAEVGLVLVLILLLQGPHVVGNVATDNVLTEDLRVQLSLGETDEALGGVRDIQTTISSSLQRGEDLGTSGGTGKTDIKESLEGATRVVLTLNVVLLTVDLLSTRVQLVETEVLQVTAGQQQTSAVSGGVVVQTEGDTITGELVGVGRADDTITRELGVDQLVDNVLVGDTDNHAVLGGGILVLVLGHKPLAGIVVSFAL